MIGTFVTANLAGLKDPRQGWVIEGPLYKIQGQSGEVYICEEPLEPVVNPPSQPASPGDGDTAVSSSPIEYERDNKPIYRRFYPRA